MASFSAPVRPRLDALAGGRLHSRERFYMARLPPIQDTPVELCESHEDLLWKPDSISDVDLLMYLRASRSMAAFVGWCDGGSTDDGCAAASMDETTINSLQLLHDNAYNTGRALQALVKVINPKSVDRRWSDEDAKRFVRGLKQHGKNFFKIRRDLLPGKSTAELVEYYYLWKKLSLTARPQNHRRRRVLRRQPPTPPTPPSSESVEEPTSPSDGSENEIESDEAVDYVCCQCHATQSTTWFEVNGKPGSVVCASCKSFRRTRDSGELPPYVFRPVKEEGQPVDQQLDSLSSDGDGSQETANSEESCTNADRRAITPSSCSSQAGVSSDVKTGQASSMAAGSPEPEETPRSAVLAELAEGAPSCDDAAQPAKQVPLGKADAGFEQWKVPDLKVATKLPESIESWQSVPPTNRSAAVDESDKSADFCPVEPVLPVKKEVRDQERTEPMLLPMLMQHVKGEGDDLSDPTINRSSPSQSSVKWQDVSATMMQPSRAMASVVPSQWKCGPGGGGVLLPPPAQLLHSAPVASMPMDIDSRSPTRTPSRVGERTPDASDMQLAEQSDEESDMETGRRSPSPELRPIYEHCYRSKSAILMRRWYRGRNTCSRSDIEFTPVPGSALAAKREQSHKARPASSVKNNTASSSSLTVKDARRSDVRPDVRRDDEQQRKKNRTPPENRSYDAQITSTLMSMHGMDMPPGLPRAPMYPPFGPSPTPALQKLSEYIRPHANPAPEMQRYIQYGPPVPPPPQSVDPYLRMAGPMPCLPGAWDSVEKREREAIFEREMREMEMIDKMRHEMAAQGFDRLLSMGPPNPLDAPAWEELQRIYGSLALGALQPGLGVSMPPGGVFPPELMQRERERMEMIRSSQEQQHQHQQQQQHLAAAMAAANSRDNAAVAAAMAAANSRDNAAVAAAMASASGRDNAAAVFQLFQKYSQDPVMLQRHLMALSSSKDQELARMMDASSLIYHFARADPLAGADASNNGGPPPGLQQQSQQQQQPPHFPVNAPQQELMAIAQHYERVYLDMLSRPPYNSDPVLAQQLMMQMSAHHEAIRHQLALERDGMLPQQQQPSLR